VKAALFLLVVAFGQLCAVATAQDHLSVATTPSNLDNSPIYITHVTVIDTETGREAQDRTVVISGDRISEVKDSKGLKPPTGAKSVDGTGKYLIPGLWDMHVHVTRFESTYPLYLANGVTGVRDMSGPPDANRFRAELAAKNIDAPHMYLGSPIFDGPPRAWPDWIVVSTPEEARKAVDEQKQKGADFIKVHSRLSRQAYFAIVDENRRQNISVAGHVPFSVSAWEAAKHQRSFEHLYGIPLACSSREDELMAKWPEAKSFTELLRLLLDGMRSYDHLKCQRLFAELKKNGVWQVPTLTIIRDFGLLDDPKFPHDDWSRYFGRELREWFTANDASFRKRNWTAEDFAIWRELYLYDQKVLGAMFRAGIPILAGTDSVTPYCVSGFSLHEELALMVEAGVTPLGALQAATRNAAIFIKATDRYGSVTPGKKADLVLLDADPLQDIHNTTKISKLFLAGKEFDRAALDQMLRNAEAAAKA